MAVDHELHYAAYAACRARAYRHAAHARDAARAVNGLHVARVDGLHGALSGAGSALVAGACGVRYHAQTACFAAWNMAGHLGAGVVSRGELGGYLRCETFEGGLVVAVGAAGGVAACHGMLGYGSHGGNYREPGFPGHVLQLGKGVVVGTVAIHAHYHGSCAVAIEL